MNQIIQQLTPAASLSSPVCPFPSPKSPPSSQGEDKQDQSHLSMRKLITSVTVAGMDGTIYSLTVLVISLLCIRINCSSPKKDRPYPWVPDSNGLEYHMKYCGNTCGGSRIEGIFWDPQCFPCSCSSNCKMYGTCCPNHDMEWARAIFKAVDDLREENSILNDTLRAIRSSNTKYFKCVRLNYAQTGLMVASCPESEKNDTLRQLCTQDLAYSVERFAPVSRVSTGLTYRNTYCHQCNSNARIDTVIPGIKSAESKEKFPGSDVDRGETFVTWQLNISCEHYQTLYRVTSEDEFLRRAYEFDHLCTVAVVTPEDITGPEPCDSNWYDVNETLFYPECKIQDPRLLWYCHLITHPAFTTSFRGHNLFCALCDGIVPTLRVVEMKGSTARTTPSSVGGSTSRRSPISFLLGITNKHEDDRELDKCSNITWLNDRGDCEPAKCAPGKRLEPGGNCSSVLGQIRGLGYKLHLSLVPTPREIYISGSDQQFLETEIYRRLSTMASDLALQTNLMVKGDKNSNLSDSGGLLHQFIVLAYIVGSDTIPRDVFEAQVLELVKSEWRLSLPSNVSGSVTLKANMLGTEINYWYNLHQNWAYSVIKNDSSLGVTTDIPQVATVLDSPGGEKNLKRPDANEMYEYKTNSRSTKTRKPDVELWEMKEEFIDVTHSLTCSFVLFNLSEISVRDGNIKLTFMYRGRVVQVASLFDISVVDGELRICLDVFKDMVKFLWKNGESAFETAQYYFETVCVSISVACLLMSFITYCIFPALRSLPGLNNMSLCISLALAQISLLVTIRYGADGQMGKSYCTVHAIFLHYTWLAAFLWMSVCCIHMYRVFTCHGPKFTNTSSDKRRYLRYSIHAFGTPALIILLNVGISLGLTSGLSNGYDNTICFLDTQTSLLPISLALILPLCVTMLINGILFFLTVREIMQVSRFQEFSNAPERQGVITYVKLSTLTGIFCIVSVVAAQLKIPVLSFLTSPLMALQGAFIFFSFTANLRVLRLYCEWFGCNLPDAWSHQRTGGRNPTILNPATTQSDQQPQANLSNTTESSRL